MIRILVCGEGGHDVGSKTWNARASSYVAIDGWLQVFVRKILNRRASFESRRRNELILLPREASRFRRLPEGHGAKAMIAKLVAKNENFDLIIFMVDADTSSTREWRQKRREIIVGFDMIEGGPPAVACVPKSASESWLLSDPAAWKEVGIPRAKDLPPFPEEIWGGRDDVAGNHPHRLFQRICRSSDLPDNRETRVNVAGLTDIEVLRSRCPLSFAAFQDDLAIPIQAVNCDCGRECCS